MSAGAGWSGIRLRNSWLPRADRGWRTGGNGWEPEWHPSGPNEPDDPWGGQPQVARRRLRFGGESVSGTHRCVPHRRLNVGDSTRPTTYQSPFTLYRADRQAQQKSRRDFAKSKPLAERAATITADRRHRGITRPQFPAFRPRSFPASHPFSRNGPAISLAATGGRGVAFPRTRTGAGFSNPPPGVRRRIR